MTLLLAGSLDGDAAPFHVHAGPGQWVVAAHPDPDAVVAAVAGTGPVGLEVVLDERPLGELKPGERHRAQLAVAECRVDSLPIMRVADVVMLGLRSPQPSLWQALAGTVRARSARADDEAQVRALAGRVGLAGWMDRTAADLPSAVAALVDVTRALAGVPKGFVLRRPEWLVSTAQADLRTVIAAEQAIHGFAVIEFATSPAGSLGPP